MSAYYVNFQFFPHIHAPILPINYKRLQNVFNVVTKQRQNQNIERIMQFFKIAAYVQVAKLYGLVHYAACAFCPIYTACVLRLLVQLIRLFIQTWLAWAFCVGVQRARSKRVWRLCVFVSVDVKIYLCVINVCVYYNCMDVCAFVCVACILVFCAVFYLSVDWQSIIWIRRELNLFVNWYCDCRCICMW